MGNEFAHRTQFLFRTLIKLPLKMRENSIWSCLEKEPGKKTLIEWFEMPQKSSSYPKIESSFALIRNAKECGKSCNLVRKLWRIYKNVYLPHDTLFFQIWRNWDEGTTDLWYLHWSIVCIFWPTVQTLVNCTFPNTSSWESNRHCSKTDFYLKESEK